MIRQRVQFNEVEILIILRPLIGLISCGSHTLGLFPLKCYNEMDPADGDCILAGELLGGYVLFFICCGEFCWCFSVLFVVYCLLFVFTSRTTLKINKFFCNKNAASFWENRLCRQLDSERSLRSRNAYINPKLLNAACTHLSNRSRRQKTRSGRSLGTCSRTASGVPSVVKRITLGASLQAVL